jgi:Integrase core domain
MQHKHANINERAPLHPIPTANKAFTNWCIDIIGKLQTTKNGNQYIIIIVDTFTKYCEYIPVKTIDAYTIAIQFFENIVCRFGCFSTLISDRGSNFLSNIFQHLIKMCGATTWHLLAIGTKRVALQKLM